MASSTLTMANAMLARGDDHQNFGRSSMLMNTSSSNSAFDRTSSSMDHHPYDIATTRMSTNEHLQQHQEGTPRRKKSVDFTLFQQQDLDDATASLQQHQNKRMRLPSRWTPKQVVDALATCVTQSERMEAIQKAIETFSSHDDESHHNQEMAAGADAALLKHFVFVTQMRQLEVNVSDHHQQQHYNSDGGIITTEMALTVQAMELVFRSSSSMVRASFIRMGSTSLRLLLDTMEREMERRHSVANDFGAEQGEDDSSNLQIDYDSSHDASLFLQHATKLLGHFARVGDAIRTLANFPKCLQLLIRLCQPPYPAIPWQARLSALWVIANLACDAENMELMVAQEGFVDMLVNVARRPLHRSDSAMHNLEHIMEIVRSRNIASRAVLNLSWAMENKIILAENISLLDLVAELSVHRQAPLPSSHTVAGILQSTRRHAVGALRNLAAAPKRIKLHLCSYRQGHLLDVLTDAALNDPDAHVKERAFAAIHNMAIQDTAEQIVSHPALVLALRDVLLSSSSSSEEETAMKKHASSTILVLERTITPEMDAYESLQDLLQAINPAPVDSEGEDDHATGHSLSMSGVDDMRMAHETAAV